MTAFLLPYTTAMRVSGISTASSYAVLVSDEKNISKGKTVSGKWPAGAASIRTAAIWSSA